MLEQKTLNGNKSMTTTSIWLLTVAQQLHLNPLFSLLGYDLVWGWDYYSSTHSQKIISEIDESLDNIRFPQNTNVVAQLVDNWAIEEGKEKDLQLIWVQLW